MTIDLLRASLTASTRVEGAPRLRLWNHTIEPCDISAHYRITDSGMCRLYAIAVTGRIVQSSDGDLSLAERMPEVSR